MVNLIGEQAEKIVYHFSVNSIGSIVLGLTDITQKEVHNVYTQVLHVMIANWLEQFHRTPDEHKYHNLEYFKRSLPYLNSNARQQLGLHLQ